MYDAAHAFGTEIDGTGVGNFGDITMFSFHATKLFHTCEGGALTFRNRELKTLIDLLRNFGIKNEEEVVLPGINGRMNEIQAVIGLLNLRNLDEERDRRRRLVDVYREQLTGVSGIRIFETPANVTKSYTYFMIRIGPEFPLGRDEAYRRLKEYNINTRRYFYPLCSDYECYRHLPSAQPDNLPVAHRVSREVLCLPLYGELPVQQVERCCEILRGLGR
jgi:dTDP-4-amino-4,6-dideoxygalactose transaminase